MAAMRMRMMFADGKEKGLTLTPTRYQVPDSAIKNKARRQHAAGPWNGS
jgi:hypothetical protein